MDYRRLGASGLQVSPICLGTMMFGGRTGDKEAARIVASARAAGINFLDTADAYNGGKSERVAGRLIKSGRDDWVVATKVGNPMGNGPNRSGLGRKWMMRAIDGSLRRLGTGYIDVYYLHLPDDDTPLEETIRAMGDLVAAGKVRYWGLSNYRAWQIAEMVRLCEGMGVPLPTVCQPYYNAMNRMPEVEVLPACDHYGLGVVPYSPLARGVLTAKYTPGKAPGRGTRAASGDVRILEAEFRKESMVIAGKLKTHAEKRGMTAGQFAFNWVLNNAIVTSVLAGPRTYAQWREYLGALEHTFTDADEALVDKLVPPGHPSTPGFSDPRYPLMGRVPLS